MTEQQINELIERLTSVTGRLDEYSATAKQDPKLGAPAMPAQLDALERHWGVKLPPSYREFLRQSNGLTRFWHDVPLLSTDDIIDDTKETGTFAEPFPKLWRTIFACGTDSYSALAFDLAERSETGELAVVALDDQGEDERWPTFEHFLRAHVERMEAELLRERADRQGLGE